MATPKDSMNKINKLALFSIILIIAICCKTIVRIDKGNLIGDWAEKEDKNVVFTITHENIKYFEDDYLYNYKFEENTFSLLDSGHIIARYEIISLTKDRLIWKAEEGDILRLVKRK